MKRLKALGLALVAVFAMSAIAASSASAVTGEIEVVGGGSATITGGEINGEVTAVATPKNEFKTKFGVIKCSPSSFHGVATNGSKELTLTPTFGNTTAGTGCTIAGIAGPVVHMNGCHFIFTLTVSGASVTADVHVICPPGKVIDITASAFCTITIPEQTINGNPITLVNTGGGGSAMDVHAIVDATGIDYVGHDIAPGTCPNGGDTGTKTETDGIYRGVVTLQGEAIPPGSGAIGVTVK